MESVELNQELSVVVVAAEGERCADCVLVSRIFVVFGRLIVHRLCSFQPSAVPETPTVCASPRTPFSCGSARADNSDSDSGLEEGGANAGIPIDLSDRAPTVECVIGVLMESELVTKSVDHSPLFAETSSDCLYSPDIWCQVNDKLVTALAACAATAEKDVKAMTIVYLQECITINQFVARLCSSDMF